jgi:hypothetical protein
VWVHDRPVVGIVRMLWGEVGTGATYWFPDHAKGWIVI